ncbi:hypothetical protein [Cupriavidus necator]
MPLTEQQKAQILAGSAYFSNYFLYDPRTNQNVPPELPDVVSRERLEKSGLQVGRVVSAPVPYGDNANPIAKLDGVQFIVKDMNMLGEVSAYLNSAAGQQDPELNYIDDKVKLAMSSSGIYTPGVSRYTIEVDTPAGKRLMQTDKPTTDTLDFFSISGVHMPGMFSSGSGTLQKHPGIDALKEAYYQHYLAIFSTGMSHGKDVMVLPPTGTGAFAGDHRTDVEHAVAYGLSRAAREFAQAGYQPTTFYPLGVLGQLSDSERQSLIDANVADTEGRDLLSIPALAKQFGHNPLAVIASDLQVTHGQGMIGMFFTSTTTGSHEENVAGTTDVALMSPLLGPSRVPIYTTGNSGIEKTPYNYNHYLNGSLKEIVHKTLSPPELSAPAVTPKYASTIATPQAGTVAPSTTSDQVSVQIYKGKEGEISIKYLNPDGSANAIAQDAFQKAMGPEYGRFVTAHGQQRPGVTFLNASTTPTGELAVSFPSKNLRDKIYTALKLNDSHATRSSEDPNKLVFSSRLNPTTENPRPNFPTTWQPPSTPTLTPSHESPKSPVPSGIPPQPKASEPVTAPAPVNVLIYRGQAQPRGAETVHEIAIKFLNSDGTVNSAALDAFRQTMGPKYQDLATVYTQNPGIIYQDARQTKTGELEVSFSSQAQRDAFYSALKLSDSHATRSSEDPNKLVFSSRLNPTAENPRPNFPTTWQPPSAPTLTPSHESPKSPVPSGIPPQPKASEPVTAPAPVNVLIYRGQEQPRGAETVHEIAIKFLNSDGTVNSAALDAFRQTMGPKYQDLATVYTQNPGIIYQDARQTKTGELEVSFSSQAQRDAFYSALKLSDSHATRSSEDPNKLVFSSRLNPTAENPRPNFPTTWQPPSAPTLGNPSPSTTLPITAGYPSSSTTLPIAAGNPSPSTKLPLPAGYPSPSTKLPLPAGYPSSSTTLPITAGYPSSSTTLPITAGYPSSSTTLPLPAGNPGPSTTLPLPAGYPSSSTTLPITAGNPSVGGQPLSVDPARYTHITAPKPPGGGMVR